MRWRQIGARRVGGRVGRRLDVDVQELGDVKVALRALVPVQGDAVLPVQLCERGNVWRRIPIEGAIVGRCSALLAVAAVARLAVVPAAAAAAQHLIRVSKLAVLLLDDGRSLLARLIRDVLVRVLLQDAARCHLMALLLIEKVLLLQRQSEPGLLLLLRLLLLLCRLVVPILRVRA